MCDFQRQKSLYGQSLYYLRLCPYGIFASENSTVSYKYYLIFWKHFITIIINCFIFFRWRSSTVIRRHPQFSFQIRPTLGPALYFFGKTRLGPIFLQSRPKRGVRAHAQEPAGFHHYEPNRSQFGTSDSCGKTSCIVHFF